MIIYQVREILKLEINYEFRDKSEKLEQLLEILEGIIQKSACKIKQQG